VHTSENSSFYNFIFDSCPRKYQKAYCIPFARWTENTATSIWGETKTIWDNTGIQYGPKGQLLLLLLVGAVAYKALDHFRSSSSKKEVHYHYYGPPQ